MKRILKKTQTQAKGMPSAVVLSVLIHIGLFLLAGTLVVFTVKKKEETTFVPPKAIERPKMQLRKPKVQVKKTSKPKPTTRIVTKNRKTSLPDIQLPEMSGMAAVGVDLGGFDLMPDLGNVSVFGGAESIGNDFEGLFYDLKRGRRGGRVPMDEHQFRQVLRELVRGGWKESKLDRYYRAPNKLYTTHFMVPPIPAPMAPDVFGSPETESYFFFVKYKGKLVYQKDITFRFWGTGDAYIMVRVAGKDVLLACWPFHEQYFDWWLSDSADSRKYYLGNQVMAVGDWITLKAGEPVDMEVMYGEWKGGQVAGMLLVEVEGVEYPRSRQGGPILPAFKTEEFSQDMLEEVRKYLPEGEASLTNGPVFRDF